MGSIKVDKQGLPFAPIFVPDMSSYHVMNSLMVEQLPSDIFGQLVPKRLLEPYWRYTRIAVNCCQSMTLSMNYIEKHRGKRRNFILVESAPSIFK